MGCAGSKDVVARENAVLHPPSKIMDASQEAKTLILSVRRSIRLYLETNDLGNLEATQMITRDAAENYGTMYYIKVKTNIPKLEYPWIFVKVWKPQIISTASPIKFHKLKKLKEDFALVTF